MTVRVLIDLAALSRLPLGPVTSRKTDPAGAARPWSALGTTAATRFPVNQAALPTLGRLAREGVVELCSYAEISDRGAAPPTGMLLDWLGEVPISHVEPALDRAALGLDVFQSSDLPGALQRLCTRLKSGTRPADGPSADPEPRTADPGVAPVRGVERFIELAARTRGEHLVDLFHLWTGECAGCTWFLTADDRLAEFLSARVRPALGSPLRCNPIEAEQLLALLGVEPRDPPPAGTGSVVALFAPRRRKPAARSA